MDEFQFDALTRSLIAPGSRRQAVATAIVGLLGAFGARPAAAKKAKKAKKPKNNAFGCLDVGQNCRSSDRKCCSGICHGKKPKKGNKDTTKCVAHNVGGCTLDRAPSASTRG